HQILEGLRVAFAEEVARALPAEDGTRRVAPGGAAIGLVAGEEVEEERGLAERPFPAAVAAAEDLAEELLRLLAIEEVLLVGRALVGVAGRDRYPVDAERLHVVEEGGVTVGIGAVEERAVDVDAEAARLGGLDRGDGPVVGAGLADRLVVVLAVAVEMHRPGEIGSRLEEMELLLEEQRVG